jgi:excisionase family DNA binding protein
MPPNRTAAEPERRRLIDTNELAAALGCSRRHVYDLATEGRIPSVRVGVLWRFDLDEVLASLGGDREAP